MSNSGPEKRIYVYAFDYIVTAATSLIIIIYQLLDTNLPTPQPDWLKNWLLILPIIVGAFSLKVLFSDPFEELDLKATNATPIHRFIIKWSIIAILANLAATGLLACYEYVIHYEYVIPCLQQKQSLPAPMWDSFFQAIQQNQQQSLLEHMWDGVFETKWIWPDMLKWMGAFFLVSFYIAHTIDQATLLGIPDNRLSSTFHWHFLVKASLLCAAIYTPFGTMAYLISLMKYTDWNELLIKALILSPGMSLLLSLVIHEYLFTFSREHRSSMLKMSRLLVHAFAIYAVMSMFIVTVGNSQTPYLKNNIIYTISVANTYYGWFIIWFDAMLYMKFIWLQRN